MSRVPAFCGAGSSLTPTTIAAPVISTLTATSYQSLPTQTLVCVLPDLAPGQATGYSFTANVRPEMPNGAVMETNASISSTSLTEPVQLTPLTQTVSAALKLDVSINGATATENSAFVKQATVQRCSAPANTGQWCYVGGYPVTISVPENGMGASPVAGGNLSFQIQTDPVTIWGQEAVDAAASQGVTLPGGTFWIRQDSPYESPNSYMSSGTIHNSVRNSGTISMTQSGTGQPINVSVTLADTTAYTVPTDATSPAGYKVRTDRGYLWTQRVFVEVPLTVVMNNQAVLDNLAGFDTNAQTGVMQMPITVEANESTLTASPITGLSGSTSNLYSDPDGTANNYRTGVATLENYQAISTHWDSPANYATGTAPAVYSPGYPAWWGPSGPTGRDTGDGVIVEDQAVLSAVSIEGNTLAGTTTVTCSAFDNSLVQVDPTVTSIVPNTGPAQQEIGPVEYPTFSDVDSGGATWINGSMVNWQSPTQQATASGQKGMVDRFGEFSVLYGVGAVDDISCTQAITWYTAEQVAAGVDGVTWADINKVQTFIQNKPGINAVYQRTTVSTAMRVVGDLAAGTVIPTYVNSVQAAGAVSYADMTGTPADPLNRSLPADAWIRTTYDPALDTFSTTDSNGDSWYDDNGAFVPGRTGDRLTVVDVVANIAKQTLAHDGTYVTTDSWIPSQSGTTNEWVPAADSTVPIYGPGQSFSYLMTPTLSSNPTTDAGVRDVLIEDCLPIGLTLENASPAPNHLQADMLAGELPYQQQLQCDSGEFYVAWYYPGWDITQQLSPITMNVKVLETAQTGMRSNEIRISVDGVPSNVDQRTAFARVNIEAPDGLSIAKLTQDPIIYVDPIGWVSSRYDSWEIRVRNLNSGQTISNLDIIDFIPINGIEGSTFSGTGEFVDASVLADQVAGVDVQSGVQILYTSAAVTSSTLDAMRDPANTAYNGASGSTAWCSLNADGTYTLVSGAGSCPTAAADVTGIRVQRPGEFPNGGYLSISMRTDAQFNVGDDLMYNATMMRVDGMDVPLVSDAETIFVDRDVPPNTGTISGAIWDDFDSDGLWDPDESPMAGQTVTLLNADGTPALTPAGNPNTAVTRDDGSYTLFLVPPNTGTNPNYLVDFTTPNGYVPTITGGDSRGDLIPVTLGPDLQYATGIDTGYRAPGNLDITKTVSGASQTDGARVGDVLTYTVTATNASDRAFTDLFPARLIDSLAGVLDDATLVDGSVQASSGTVAVNDGQLVWYGPLASGESVTITYQVTVTGSGDALSQNIAFVSDPPIDTTTGYPIDPATGDPVPVGTTVLNPTPTGTVTPPTIDACTAPDCATTATPIIAPVPAPTPGPTPPVDQLARTGFDVSPYALMMITLLGAGTVFLANERKKQQSA